MTVSTRASLRDRKSTNPSGKIEVADWQDFVDSHKVGDEVTAEEAYLCARRAGLAMLASLREALGDLDRIDPLAARVVEVLFFGGLTHDEASEALGVGRATVGRKWRFARAWLATRLAA